MRTHRDFQREKVYAWEGKASQAQHKGQNFRTIEECQAYLNPIWLTERGRYGRARVPAPAIERPHWGQRRAFAHADHRITLPTWCRNEWMILHEAAHRLAVRWKDVAHGPRFVGILIGLVCRHLDYDASEQMRIADEMGVRYDVRSIGSVPVHGPTWHVERVLRAHGAMTPMEIACELSIVHGHDLGQPQIRGAALQLIRGSRARWWRGKLVLVSQDGDAGQELLAA
ncbi:hypothetical protein [Ramlibacter sp. AN1133]|uniref:hypothetical protein n=1 Tax=Ramlibacter sp. AN1133 TaxID=3133429 RepID=UPI0030C55EFB